MDQLARCWLDIVIHNHVSLCTYIRCLYQYYVPYAYGIAHMHIGCPIHVWAKMRIWGRTIILILWLIYSVMAFNIVDDIYKPWIDYIRSHNALHGSNSKASSVC